MFLRFRSRNRDVWRAGFLPAKAVAALDAWIGPHLPQGVPTGEGLPETELPLDLHDVSVLLTGLSITQREWGGLLCYGDPSDEVQQYAHALREAVIAAWQLQAWNYPFFARLSREQLQRLDAGGLTLGVDISLLDVPADLHEWWVDNVRRGDVVRLDRVSSEEVGVPPARDQMADYTATVWSQFWLMHPDGRGSTSGGIPRNLLLRPSRLPHLVPPPPEYAQ